MKNRVKNTNLLLPADYKYLLSSIKEKIQHAQLKTATTVNQKLIKLYWDIGNAVRLKQDKEGWGVKTIDKLAQDLKSTFPNMKGFSKTNIKYMVQFSQEYLEYEISQQAVGQIPWGHSICSFAKA